VKLFSNVRLIGTCTQFFKEHYTNTQKGTDLVKKAVEAKKVASKKKKKKK
jgi:hypothetical protein